MGTESGAVAIYQLLAKRKADRETDISENTAELIKYYRDEKISVLSIGGDVIGDSFIFRDSDGVKYVWNLNALEVDNSARFIKSDDWLNCRLSRNLFVDEKIDGRQAELGITVVIKSKGQVFNEVFRSKLSLSS